jgi:hypothetical protein
MARIDLSGQKFGRLLVTRYSGNTKLGEARWDCVCDCGETSTVLGMSLKKGVTKSCGCLRREVSAQRIKIRPFEALYHKLIRRCKDRNTECDISYEDFLQFVKIEKCHYCLDNVIWTKHHLRANTGGCNLDRKDNEKGYLKNNCLVCCGACNSMKGSLTYAGFLERINKIYESRSSTCR